MTSTDYGPVPVSRLKADRKNALAALDAGRNVLLSRHGRVVAMLTPLEEQHSSLVQSLFTAPDASGVPVLTMSAIEAGSPSAVIRSAERGTDALVADLKRNRVYGVLTAVLPPISEADGLDRADRIDRFLKDFPSATADDLADFSEELDAEARGNARVLAEVAAVRTVLAVSGSDDERSAVIVEVAKLLPEAIAAADLDTDQALAVSASLGAAEEALGTHWAMS